MDKLVMCDNSPSNTTKQKKSKHKKKRNGVDTCSPASPNIRGGKSISDYKKGKRKASQ